MLVNAGLLLSKVIFVTDAVPVLPAASVPLKEMVYIAPSTNVGRFDKYGWTPPVNAVPLRVTTWGELPSSVPPVLVKVTLPEVIFTLRE